jgi:hypothetical protein
MSALTITPAAIEVALPTLVTSPVRFAFVVTFPEVRPAAVPVMFVPTKALGVPSAGVTSVGLALYTRLPVPVAPVLVTPSKVVCPATLIIPPTQRAFLTLAPPRVPTLAVNPSAAVASSVPGIKTLSKAAVPVAKFKFTPAAVAMVGTVTLVRNAGVAALIFRVLLVVPSMTRKSSEAVVVAVVVRLRIVTVDMMFKY